MEKENRKPVILPVDDRSVDYWVKKDKLFDLPMRLPIVGPSQFSGKTNFLFNLLMRSYDDSDEAGRDMYRHDFRSEDIYIISPSLNIDKKLRELIRLREIPESNGTDVYNEEELSGLYNYLKEQFEDAIRLIDEWEDNGKKGEKPPNPRHTLIIADDCSFDGSLKSKMNGIISKIACNGRHLLISLIVTSQKHCDLLTTLRRNATGYVLFGTNDAELDLIHNDVSKHPKTVFKRTFHRVTEPKHSYMICNKTNTGKMKYMDEYFDPIEFK